MDYPVSFGGKTVGKVQLVKEGLYYHAVCRCQITGEIICRLVADCGGKRENLGILVPMEPGFGLETRFPVSRLGEGEISFRLLPRHDPLDNRVFVPIKPEEPFAYLSRLKDAFLETRDGALGASLPGEAAQKENTE